jgi:hypothetical protein
MTLSHPSLSSLLLRTLGLNRHGVWGDLKVVVSVERPTPHHGLRDDFRQK